MAILRIETHSYRPTAQTEVQDAVEGNVVGGNEFVSKTVNHLPCSIYRHLAIVNDTRSTVVTFWRCLAPWLTALLGRSTTPSGLYWCYSIDALRL